MREAVKRVARVLALVAVTPQLISFALRSRVVGRDRALEGSTQALALVPGLAGQYLRRAFLAHALSACHETAAICFALSDDGVYGIVRHGFSQSPVVAEVAANGVVPVTSSVMIAPRTRQPSGRIAHTRIMRALPRALVMTWA